MLKHPIPGTQNTLFVSKDGNFYKINGEECDLPIKDGKVEIKMHGEVRHVDKTWLTQLAVFGINDPRAFENVTFVETPTNNRWYPWQVIFKRPVVYGNGFRIVPGFETVAVNKYGKTLNVQTGEAYAVVNPEKDYSRITAYDPRAMRHRSLVLHRLVALAWVHNPAPNALFVVNHLDGNKHNPVWSNLEWTTHKQNLQHAVYTGLRPEAIQARARDIHSGEVHVFPSTAALAKFLGMANKQERMFKAARANKVYAGKYEVRIGNDDRPWVYTEAAKNVGSSRYVFIVKEGQNELRFNGSRSIIKHYKLWNLPTMSAREVKKVMRERFPEFEVKVIDQYPSREIQVMDLSTGKIVTYPRVTDAAEATGVPKGRVVEACRLGGKYDTRGYRFRYATAKSWDELAINPYLPRRIEVTDKLTSERNIYYSLRKVSDALSMGRNAVVRHIEKPKESDAYLMRYAS